MSASFVLTRCFEAIFVSPNAEEALSLLSISMVKLSEKLPIEEAAQRLLELGTKSAVIIRSGGLGAYVLTRERGGKWIDAFWSEDEASKIVNVTGECDMREMTTPQQ